MPVIVIEGNIGCGKSTLLKRIKERYPDVEVVQEPVNDWYSIKDDQGVSVFERYYQDPKKYAFQFQMNVMASRMNAFQTAMKSGENGRNRLVIFERSLMTDNYVFMSTLYNHGTVSELEFSIFKKMYQSIMDHVPQQIDTILYLQCEPSTCYERMKTRNRTGEETVPLAYLEDLHAAHETWLNTVASASIPICIFKNDGGSDDATWQDLVESFRI